ncbi:MAG: ABC transporter permease [Trueperaceae bacterium]|nr:ABC transporter permease [Trueperaceae bacterium]
MRSTMRIPSRLVGWWTTTPELLPLTLVIVEIAVFAMLSPHFLSTGNISNVLAFSPELGMIALGMTVLMTSGEFDLSVGSVFGFTPIVMWTLFNEGVMPLAPAFVIALAVAAAVGFVNGWFVTRLRIPSFLVTLGMMMTIRGTALYTTSGFPQRTWDAEGWLLSLVAGAFYIGDFRVYATLLWFIGFAIVLAYLLTQTKVGNWIQAAGGNPESARARGVGVAATKTWLFILTAFLSGFAGIASSMRVSAANPNSGTGYELEVIAMVVIGGTALMGGRGTIVGTVLGVLMLRMMRNGIVLIGVPGLAYNIFIGVTILAMMALQSFLERRNPAATR